jgi:oxygen-independent coproporphyrinogen III oxidase
VTNLFNKYDVPAPRYTSYPTVPYWSENPTNQQWMDFVQKNMNQPSTAWAMYVHIPYCETLCTFCGCNTSITKNHEREEPYVHLIFKEWDAYKKNIKGFTERPLRQLHLGGGTPTFLSAKNLDLLVGKLLADVTIDPQHFEGAIEVDPRRTKLDQLEVLRKHKFNRISLGVQDFDSEVQRLVNRVQPFEMTESITKGARDLGYESVNFDLIYGLPTQNLDKIRRMIDLTVQLRPDRIALYSLAVVPWIKPAQKLFKDEDLPQGEEKRKLYEVSRELLLQAGYKEIGMDHFALPTDSLYKSSQSGELHRNFMGYADIRTDVLLGLGVSAISETPECFHQNEKALPVYESIVSQEKVPTLRGHVLSDEDREQREQILLFMTRGEVALRSEQVDSVKSFLKEMIQDGLVEVTSSHMKMTDKGTPFLRNACMALDQRFRTKSPTAQVFSKAL